MLFTVADRPAVPHATSDQLTVDARTITLGLGGDEVSASGDVRTQSIPDRGDGARGAAYFEPGRVGLGIAEEFHYLKRDGLATYTGGEKRPARLQQDGNEIVGATILLRDPSGDLSASGGVESVFVVEAAEPRDPAAEPGAPDVPYRIRADTLEYREAERTATYTGAPVTLKSGEAETEAERVVLRLSADTRDVERVEWYDGVYMLFEKQYEAKGDRLTYDLASGGYVLDGRPAVTKLPDSGSTLCVKATGLKTTFNRRTNQAAWPAQDNTRGANLNVKIPCTTSIR
jgi:lipopolysaccharide export system protein LptA